MQYLCLDDLPVWGINKLEYDIKKAGFNLQYEFSDKKTYIVLLPEVIEYIKPNGKGILKKNQIKLLKNTL